MRLSMTPCPPVTIRPKSTRRNLFFKNNVTSANSGDYPEERGNQMTLGKQCGLVKPSDWPSHGGLQLRADCGPGHKPPPPALWASVSPHGEAETAVHWLLLTSLPANSRSVPATRRAVGSAVPKTGRTVLTRRLQHRPAVSQMLPLHVSLLHRE